MKNEEWIPVRGGLIHPQVVRDIMADMTRGWNRIAREAEIEAFERWRDTPEPIDTRMLERLTTYVNEETSH